MHCTYHKITFHECQLIGQSLLLGICGSTLNLVVIVVETSDVGAGKLCDFACRAPYSTANIKDFHAILDANLSSQIVLMTRNSLRERLAICETAEVKGLSPTVLI